MAFMKIDAPPAQPRGSGERATADELLIKHAHRRCELIRGEIVDMSPCSLEHGVIVLRLGHHLYEFVVANDLGHADAGDVGYKIASDPDTVRAPDLGFIAKPRIPPEHRRAAFYDGAPDLAVEVISASDTPDYIQGKIRDWLQAGSQEVWIVSPRCREVTIHRSGRAPQTFDMSMMLRSDVLPGFALEVRKVFED